MHQATKDWYKTQDKRMMEFNSEITRSKSDPGFYYLVKTSKGCDYLDFWFMVSLHIDDYAVAYSHEDFYKRWILFLNVTFKLSELGDVSNLLGLKILRTPSTIYCISLSVLSLRHLATLMALQEIKKFPHPCMLVYI